ncbi:hypothetical protein H0A36_27630 [Endozoicomonas sp. SM1973]|uniref:Uncharacterized protein n=1 Tax=Spartinivicinus marinus TaxID=2994442 RepID=A0A853IK81_9GAMM|nr:hypothetical protein [Spartinivicinus marinus]MCX4030374.1 hypothetical protein [Spartinivicinus marinus]NYZ69787.1 hypothetical protein [Spartinivicinus marinus]
MSIKLATGSGAHDLYERIMAYPFNEGVTEFPFEARLARDNGWSLGFAVRVITEYRRFLFLAMEAGHPVTPSDQVDQAWHLHLLYTKSYWDKLCGETLGRPLHHNPTKGGSCERNKFDNWYNKTLESYRLFFDKEPPADIWPEANIRFGTDIHYQRVNTKQNLIIPMFGITVSLKNLIAKKLTN